MSGEDASKPGKADPDFDPVLEEKNMTKEQHASRHLVGSIAVARTPSSRSWTRWRTTSSSAGANLWRM